LIEGHAGLEDHFAYPTAVLRQRAHHTLGHIQITLHLHPVLRPEALSKIGAVLLAKISPPDRLQQVFVLHLEAYQRRNELLAECQRLMEAGHRRAAKRCLAAAAEELQELLTALVRAR